MNYDKSALESYDKAEMYIQNLQKNEHKSDNLAMKILDDIRHDMRHRMSLSEMEKRYNYSREHIIRTFKKSMNITPYSCNRYFVLKQSAKLLTETDRTVDEISKIVGYSSLNSYSAQFKKLFELSPNEYRHKFKTN